MVFLYTLLGNLIIRELDERTLLQDLTKPPHYYLDEMYLFFLGCIFPVILLFFAVKELSTFIYYKIKD